MFIYFANLYINMYVKEQRVKLTYSSSENFWKIYDILK